MDLYRKRLNMKGLLLLISISVIAIGVGWCFDLTQNEVEKTMLGIWLVILYNKLDKKVLQIKKLFVLLIYQNR